MFTLQKIKNKKKVVWLVAIKITNNSEWDIIFERDTKLTYANGSEVFIMENDRDLMP
jgi:hypothetical protein